MRVVVAAFCLAVALLMLAWWAWSVTHGALRRPDRAPAEIRLHLAAELLTAALLLVGGVVVLAGGSGALALVGLGMLLYTVVASPGYFLARGEWPPVVMFAVLFVAAAAVTVAAATA